VKLGTAYCITKLKQPLYVTDIIAASRLGNSLGTSLSLLLPHSRGFHLMFAQGLLRFIKMLGRQANSHKFEFSRCVGRGMANHQLAVGVYSQSCWWTYAKSLEDSESVEKVTSSFLEAEQNTNYDSGKSHFDKIIDGLPGVR